MVGERTDRKQGGCERWDVGNGIYGPVELTPGHDSKTGWGSQAFPPITSHLLSSVGRSAVFPGQGRSKQETVDSRDSRGAGVTAWGPDLSAFCAQFPSLSGGEVEGVAVVPHQVYATVGLGFTHGCERALWGALDTALPKSEPVWTRLPYHKRLPGLPFRMSAALRPLILQSPTESCTQERIVPSFRCQGPFSLVYNGL